MYISNITPNVRNECEVENEMSLPESAGYLYQLLELIRSHQSIRLLITADAVTFLSPPTVNI